MAEGIFSSPFPSDCFPSSGGTTILCLNPPLVSLGPFPSLLGEVYFLGLSLGVLLSFAISQKPYRVLGSWHIFPERVLRFLKIEYFSPTTYQFLGGLSSQALGDRLGQIGGFWDFPPYIYY
jgi:hypothetical protein